MLKIALISNEEDTASGVDVDAKLLEPSGDGIEGGLVGDVVHQHSTLGTVVNGARDGLEALLSSSIPDLNLAVATIDLIGLGHELNADSARAVLVELVAGVAGHKVRLSDATVSNDHNLEHKSSIFSHGLFGVV